PYTYYPEEFRITPIGWVIGYASDEDTLQRHPEAISFIEPLSWAPATIPATAEDSTVVEAEIGGFGDSIKAVVLAVGAMPSGQYTFLGATGNWLLYEYSFGVSTPEIVPYSRIDGILQTQPDTAAVGCPQGDAHELVVAVALDPDFYDGPVAASDFGILPPDTSEFYVTAEADSDATLIDGMYRTTITLSQFGACGYGDLTVILNGEALGTVFVDMRSVDLISSGGSAGVVGLADLGAFGNAYPPNPYNRCADYLSPFGQVGLSDWGYFGAHYGHTTPGGSASLTAAAATDATLRLDVQEEYPLVGERRLWATLSIENIEPFTAMVVSLRSDHPRLRFVAWHADDAYPETTLGTEVVRDGVKQTFIGILGDGEPHEPVLDFGRVEFEVLGEDPLVLSEEDLEFLIADLEVVGGGLRSFSPLRLEKAEVQPTYHFELAQNVPNPFNPTTTIAYSLASDSDVALAIFDVRGARVKTLASGRETTGIHRVPWDGTDDRGVRVSSGVYFYRLIAGTFKSTKKMVLLR
ncbi:MAG: FlgD immunoglobulin-like domain containing protein, partial [Polyangiales bacterium]